jgi:hypothetical protein
MAEQPSWATAKLALLGRAAGRVEGNRYFLGHLLALYRELAGIDEDGLAAELGCGREGLVRLALCRAPREGAAFRVDLAQAVSHAGADLVRLIPIVRRAQAAEALRAAGGADLLAAARDADEPDHSER